MKFKVAAVIVAAGRGLRAGGGLPKQYRELDGKPALQLGPLAAVTIVSSSDDWWIVDGYPGN